MDWCNKNCTLGNRNNEKFGKVWLAYNFEQNLHFVNQPFLENLRTNQDFYSC